MVYALYGFIFGLFIPYLARRFAKFMPATLAYALFDIFRPRKKTVAAVLKENPRYMDLRSAFRWRSFVSGLATGALSYAAYYRFGEMYLCWYLLFIWASLLLIEIDYKMQILPDIITVPLLIFGFGYSVFVGVWVGPGESFIGAFAGYFLPVIASLFLVWKNKDVFGGGDIKYLAVVGAWMGLDRLLYVIIAACVLFALYALLKRKREGAFGPALAGAAILTALAAA